MAELPEFLQHLKCFDGWRVQSDPKEAVKRYYEKHPEELKKKKRKPRQPPKRLFGSYGKLQLDPIPCEECGKMFTPPRRDSRFCSNRCSGRYHSRKQYVKLKEQDLNLRELQEV